MYCWCCFWSCVVVFFFKQKTAYEMRISDWSSDVCSSDLHDADARAAALPQKVAQQGRLAAPEKAGDDSERDRIMHVAGLPGSHRSADRSGVRKDPRQTSRRLPGWERSANDLVDRPATRPRRPRSEEHTSELQSLMRISYAVFCLKKKKQ